MKFFIAGFAVESNLVGLRRGIIIRCRDMYTRRHRLRVQLCSLIMRHHILWIRWHLLHRWLDLVELLRILIIHHRRVHLRRYWSESKLLRNTIRE